MAHQVEAGTCSSPCIEDEQGNPDWGTDSQSPAQAPGTSPDPKAGVLHTDQVTQLLHTYRGGQFHADFPGCGPKSLSSHDSVCSPFMIMIPLVHTIPTPSLHQDSRTWPSIWL